MLPSISKALPGLTAHSLVAKPATITRATIVTMPMGLLRYLIMSLPSSDMLGRPEYQPAELNIKQVVRRKLVGLFRAYHPRLSLNDRFHPPFRRQLIPSLGFSCDADLPTAPGPRP